MSLTLYNIMDWYTKVNNFIQFFIALFFHFYPTIIALYCILKHHQVTVDILTQGQYYSIDTVALAANLILHLCVAI